MQTTLKSLETCDQAPAKANAGSPIPLHHDQTKRKILVWQVVAVLQSAMIVGLVQFL